MPAAPRISLQRPNAQTPLRELLNALAEETADLAACADQLQDLFGQLLAEPPVRPGDAVEQAQTLDGLVQRLHGLSAFLAGLSSRALQDLPAEAAEVASALRLTSQGRRFSPHVDPAPPPTSPGYCQLF